MLYFVKFLYQTLLMPPGIFIALLLLVSTLAFRKRQQKTALLLLFTTLGLYLASTSWIADQLARPLESKYRPPTQASGDVIIMLGGGATLDTPNIYGQGHLSGFAANRLLTAAQLYHILHVPIIVSGGQVFQTTGCEAEIAKSILQGLGIPANDIFIENKSLNTTENAKYTKEIIAQHNFKRPILVTSAFHMERAVHQFEKINLTVIPYPTDYLTNVQAKLEAYHFWPSAHALLETQLALKEYIGIFASRFY